ncbi:helix-turn-helix domain-containing protein [Actinomadura harenae]|uniref:Helix-turn-helix domain-containing protein n=2 Tax=Actinomadura harenae TaxID=2483351 RepID=A0A3M2LXY4_9ACTN|nr:helix-turn-helix domain-containing protein [Actinomadura harenae]
MADKVGWYTEVLSRTSMPSEIHPTNSDEFHAEGTLLGLGAIRVARFTHSPLLSRRTPRLIRAGDPEQYQLVLLLKGAAWFTQNGFEASLQPRDMALWDTSRPYEYGSGLDGRDVEAVVLQIPKAVMPLPAQQVDRFLARRLTAGKGLEVVLSDFLLSLTINGPDTCPGSLDALGSMAVELVAASLAQQLGAQRETPAEVRAHVLLRRINSFIDQNLGQPDLTPRLIADRHHISLRTLYTLFEGEPEGVAESIRRRRLEQCRADLSSPRLQDEPVQAIAGRWGFANAPAFSRLFRVVYGTTPSDYRHHILGTREHASDAAADGEMPALVPGPS